MSRRNVLLFWGFWIVAGLIWLVLNPEIFSASSFFRLRRHMMQFTGVLAIAAMSAIMILSLRPVWLERRLGGLDKVYRLHKWLGIGALALSVLHWLWSEAPKWAVGAGLLTRPTRGPRPEIADPVRSFLSGLRHPAEGLGEWAFYAMTLLIVIALWKLVPYRAFRYSHRLVPIAFLVLVFHSFVLLDYDMWTTPLGPLLALVMIGGCYAAFLSLVGRIGAGRRVEGEIVEMRNYPGVHSLETVIRLRPGWPGHKAGQFAFATSDRVEGAHPYTIVSAWDPEDPQVAFVAKELGDHTTGLVDKLRVGQKVTVEGPYGCFTFDDGRSRQVWIGAGIGITPFLARMKEMAAVGGDAARPRIDLFHTTREVEESALERIAGDARKAGVTLHLLIDERDGLLTGDRIREAVPDWREAGFWFCGPSGFGKTLKADFARHGLDVEDRFHQELFEMR